ncbi:MAG: NifB/NifX family molybdenum-iron cluster-binding protein [Candidatus Aminicenantes bacterium]|nr:NifB/NifX family molybdenum-iron cluster-binding protein [Candidatus Aminicenantes bacterium]
MKVAVSASSPDLESPVDPRFGRCPYYLFIDPETLEFEAAENPYVSASSGAGIQAAQLVVQKNVEAVLTGSCGPNAFRTLKAAGVKVMTGVTGTVSEAARKYASGTELREAKGPDVPAHHGMGRGAGAGRGRRMDGPFFPPDLSGQGPGTIRMSPEEELEGLKKQAEDLRRHMDRVSERITALKKKKS